MIPEQEMAFRRDKLAITMRPVLCIIPYPVRGAVPKLALYRVVNRVRMPLSPTKLCLNGNQTVKS
jgi:hypothetical protein